MSSPTDEEVKLRQQMMELVSITPDPINQALLDLEKLGEPYGIDTLMDYDPDTTDIDERPY